MRKFVFFQHVEACLDYPEITGKLDFYSSFNFDKTGQHNFVNLRNK